MSCVFYNLNTYLAINNQFVSYVSFNIIQRVLQQNMMETILRQSEKTLTILHCTPDDMELVSHRSR